jgi:NADPH:quinone reductase-like Zn-dependent oxidoreductase
VRPAGDKNHANANDGSLGREGNGRQETAAGPARALEVSLMKAIRLHSHSGPESLAYEDAPTPRPGDGEVLVGVRAAAVTPTELGWVPTWTTRGGEPRPFPIIPGHEFSGDIRAVGAGVADFVVGDTVFGMNDWYGDGAQAEYCVARVVDLARTPHSIDFVHAAVTPISALTAWQGLIERARLARGERVLIHGAAGGVGVFAVQLARWCGASVICTASAQNLEFVRGLGADEVIDYRTERFEDLVRDADVVFDTVGGETLARSWGVLKAGGRLITIAASVERTAEKRVQDAFFIVEPNRDQLARIASLIDGGDLQTIVGGVFPLEQARRAYEHKPIHGKVALTVA